MKIQALINLGYTGPASYEDGVLTFQDPSLPRPTDEEIEAEANRLLQEYNRTEYQRKRVREYPKLTMLADALYHQLNGNEQPMQEYMALVQAVKDKYPKK